MVDIPPLKPIFWMGSSLEDLRTFPEPVKADVGYALYLAQANEKPPTAKPLKGFKGAGILEIIENFDGNTYRAVYTIKFAGVVYVLHIFQKKSKQGIKTPKSDIELVQQRLKKAEQDYQNNYLPNQGDDRND